MYLKSTGTFLSSRAVNTKAGVRHFSKVLIDEFDDIADVYSEEEPALFKGEKVELNVKLDFANKKLGAYFAS